MRQLSATLVPVLDLIVAGYSNKAIAEKLALTEDGVNKSIKRLKNYFNDEPEMKNNQLSSRVALVLVGQRYLQLTRGDNGKVDSPHHN